MSRDFSAGELVANALGMSFAWIPPGHFCMGSPPDEKHRSRDETQHRVHLTRGFFLGVHPVSQAHWQLVMGNNPSHFQGEQLPVETVSWHDSIAFCEKLSQREGNPFRLPTEAEWEFACRAGTTTAFCCGDDPGRIDAYAWYSRNSADQTHPAGQKKPNRWGLCDMNGNVSEWCSDWYGPYPMEEATDPQGPNLGDCRVLRGGSWHDIAWLLRSASRNWNDTSYRFKIVGLRVCSSENLAKNLADLPRKA